MLVNIKNNDDSNYHIVIIGSNNETNEIISRDSNWCDISDSADRIDSDSICININNSNDNNGSVNGSRTWSYMNLFSNKPDEIYLRNKFLKTRYSLRDAS